MFKLNKCLFNLCPVRILVIALFCQLAVVFKYCPGVDIHYLCNNLGCEPHSYAAIVASAKVLNPVKANTYGGVYQECLSNMKKYILSKKEMTDLASVSTSLEGTQHYGHNMPGIEHPPQLQPPLPLDPPPLLQHFPIIIKQEIVDTKYQNIEESNNEDHNNFQNNVAPQVEPVKSQIICRDFIRGTCKRKNTCKFAHKYDLNQLVGVYTFCHKYQNSKCTYTNCKYVHASVFDEQKFYRTAMLPSHALAHHKKPKPIQRPLLPPVLKEAPFLSPPRMVPISNVPPPPTLNKIDKATQAGVDVIWNPSSSQSKRSWTAMETFGNSSRNSFKFPTKE